jgi:dTDP-4-dehydrorhamnose reductase
MPDGPTPAELPALWAGIECTVNRVGDRWFDQLARSGHLARSEADLDRIADLGVRALRYPVLWEHVAPRGIAAEWGRADAGLGRLAARGVRPIVGLLHHGSGPAGTHLLDPAFPEKLADYAAAVARRYPWIEAWTPVNEPLTTARFSGLYGHWYPHGRDDRTFVRALLAQLRATALAMRAIRAVNPRAELVQTEDVGRTTSTARLSYQADFENLRRWLGFDLLCGRVDGAHPLHGYLSWAGADAAELAWFRAHPTPPDVVGLDYYVTSDRHLDERLERYPPWSHGGNGRDAYADVEAARVPEGVAGHRWVLTEAWRRYGLPVALTEVHLGGGGREDQLRWLADAWDAAVAVRRAGVDVRGVTVWSALGAFDWNSLVTADGGYYEPGPFDVRAPRPRATALAAMTRALARGGRFDHPALAEHGWWRRPTRLFPGCAPEDDPGRAPHPPAVERARPARGGDGPAILVLGGRAGLGEAFARACAERGLGFGWIEETERAAAEVAAALGRTAAWAVVNAWETRPEDPAESEELPRGRPRVAELRAIAEACARRGVRLVSLSSDLVFDGDGGADRTEEEPPAAVPAHPRGRRERAAERAIAAGHPGALLVRTGAWFAPWRPLAFLSAALEALDRGTPFEAADDRRVSLTYGPDLAHTVLDLLVDGEAGPWHLVHPAPVSWAELARRAARIADLDPDGVVGVPAATLGLAGPRPHRPLATVRGALLAPLDAVLERFLRERVAELAAGGPAGGPPRAHRTTAPPPSPAHRAVLTNPLEDQRERPWTSTRPG